MILFSSTCCVSVGLSGSKTTTFSSKIEVEFELGDCAGASTGVDDCAYAPTEVDVSNCLGSGSEAKKSTSSKKNR